ncbi:MAG: hypothetical protein JO247_23800 [Chloroflexi bacterium]|nr:hypothetical protein [Chloroflexota bacterium]
MQPLRVQLDGPPIRPVATAKPSAMAMRISACTSSRANSRTVTELIACKNGR